jgi:hypothetical protein
MFHRAAGPMIYVSIIVEALRSRPVLVFWLAALAQAALWTLVPSLFYAAPPGELPHVLALGHELRLGPAVGPPLGYWLAEFAFRAGGMFGVYLLSQLCVLTTFYGVFTLSRALFGRTHAAMAVMLLVGIALYSVASAEFGPGILATAIWSLMLLHYWRALGEGRQRSWYALGIGAALLVMTTPVALVLIGLLVLFTAGTARGRATLDTADPWIAIIAVIGAMIPVLFWLDGTFERLLPIGMRLLDGDTRDGNIIAWGRMLLTLLVAHAGIGVLVLLASGWPRAPKADAPRLTRPEPTALAVSFTLFFAIAPALAVTILSVIVGASTPLGGAAPLAILSAPAVILACGNAIPLHRQRITLYAWTGLLLAPAGLAIAAMLAGPWTLGLDLKINQPATEIGRFVGENFERRAGKPLAIVTGDRHLAALVSLRAPSRPSVYDAAAPERTPWIGAADLARQGAVVLWVATDTRRTPPADIQRQFPDLVPEQPRLFERPVQGLLPKLWIGWAVIRPKPAS